MKHRLLLLLLSLCVSTGLSAQDWEFSYGLNWTRYSPQRETFTMEHLQRPSIEVTTPYIFNNKYGLALHTRRKLYSFEHIPASINLSAPLLILGAYRIKEASPFRYRYLPDKNQDINLWLSLPIVAEFSIGESVGSKQTVGWGGFIGVGSEQLYEYIYGMSYFQVLPYAHLGVSYRFNENFKILLTCGKNFMSIYQATADDIWRERYVLDGENYRAQIILDRPKDLLTYNFSLTISHKFSKN